MLKKILFAILIIGGVYFAYSRYFGSSVGNGAGGAGAPPVSVAEVISRKEQLWSEFSGRLIAVDSAEIRPRVSGTVEKIHFKEGQWVEKNAPLFTIDQKPYLAALQAAQAKSTFAEAEFARAKSLIIDKAIPNREYDQRKSDVENARADLTKAKLDYGYTIIKAPIAGRVSRAEITLGNLVDAGGSAPLLTTIVSSKPIYADFDIDEKTYLNYLKSAASDQNKLQNIPVNLWLSDQTDKPYEGRVQSFDNHVNLNSGTLRVRAVFDNKNEELIAGLFARIQIGGIGKNDVLLINEQAINTDQSIKFVWVVGDDNKVSYRPVKLGGMVKDLRIIIDGLKAGEKIVINGTQRIMMPNQAITPKIVGMDGKDVDSANAEKKAP